MIQAGDFASAQNVIDERSSLDLQTKKLRRQLDRAKGKARVRLEVVSGFRELHSGSYRSAAADFRSVQAAPFSSPAEFQNAGDGLCLAEYEGGERAGFAPENQLKVCERAERQASVVSRKYP